MEIGPGRGILTRALCDVARSLIAVEVDRALFDYLAGTLNPYDNLDLRRGDALEFPYETLPPKTVVVANLPYYISTPLLFRLLDARARIDRMVLMLQAEVARRMVAPPGSGEYGILSVLTQFWTEPSLAFRVSSNCFWPPPDQVVVGVVPNMRVADLKTPDAPDFSVYSTGFGGYGMMVLMVRSSLTDAAIEKAIRNAATEVDPLVPMTRIRSLQSVVDAHLAEQALFMKVLTLLAVLSVALASVGVAGLVAQSVAERTREFGIRLALGADRPNILVLVVRQGASLVLLGVPAGLLLSVILARLVRAKLYGVSALEPAVYAVAAGVLVAVTLVATLLPARAATRVDPLVALRSE